MLFLFSLVDTDHVVSDYIFHTRVVSQLQKKGDVVLSNVDPSCVTRS